MAAVANVTYLIDTLANGNYQLTFVIEENFTLFPNAKIYTTTNDKMAFQISLHEFNFLHNNTVLGGFYQKDILSSFGINYTNHQLFSRNYGLEVNLKNINLVEPLFFNHQQALYRYGLKTYELVHLFKLSFHDFLSFSTNYFEEDYRFLEGDSLSDAPLNYQTNKMALKLNYNRRNLKYHYYLLYGWTSNLNTQYIVDFKNQEPFYLITAETTFYKKQGYKGNWVTRVQVNVSKNNNTPFAPILIDNNLNVRGVGNKFSRGTAAFILNTEFRKTLYEKKMFVLQANVFIDAASHRLPGNNVKDFSSKQNLFLFNGLGLRFIHKKIYNAIFRFDVAKGLTAPNQQWGWVVGIGQFI